jgi:nucleoside-diphosphate-sugar epimerase
VINLLEVAREFPFQFVYASSCAVYGPGDGRPHGEHENLAGKTLYGGLRRAVEDRGRIYWQDWGVLSVCLRPWIVYGPG